MTSAKRISQAYVLFLAVTCPVAADASIRGTGRVILDKIISSNLPGRAPLSGTAPAGDVANAGRPSAAEAIAVTGTDYPALGAAPSGASDGCTTYRLVSALQATDGGGNATFEVTNACGAPRFWMIHTQSDGPEPFGGTGGTLRHGQKATESISWTGFKPLLRFWVTSVPGDSRGGPIRPSVACAQPRPRGAPPCPPAMVLAPSRTGAARPAAVSGPPFAEPWGARGVMLGMTIAQARSAAAGAGFILVKDNHYRSRSGDMTLNFGAPHNFDRVTMITFQQNLAQGGHRWDEGATRSEILRRFGTPYSNMKTDLSFSASPDRAMDTRAVRQRCAAEIMRKQHGRTQAAAYQDTHLLLFDTQQRVERARILCPGTAPQIARYVAADEAPSAHVKIGPSVTISLRWNGGNYAATAAIQRALETQSNANPARKVAF